MNLDLPSEFTTKVPPPAVSSGWFVEDDASVVPYQHLSGHSQAE